MSLFFLTSVTADGHLKSEKEVLMALDKYYEGLDVLIKKLIQVFKIVVIINNLFEIVYLNIVIKKKK